MKSKLRFYVVLIASLLLVVTNIGLSELKITVEKSRRWGEMPHSEIQSLCENIAFHFEQHIRPELEMHKKIKVYFDYNGPIIYYKGNDQHDIGISAEPANISQFVYQLSHEIMHVLHNHEITAKNNPNLWFQESICMMASIWVLEEMSTTWKTEAPYREWADYAPIHYNYAMLIKNRPDAQFSGTPQEWLGENEEFLRRDYLVNSFNHHILVSQFSYKFLHIFKDKPEAWNAVRKMPDTKEYFAEYITDWYDNVEAQDKIYIEDLMAFINTAPNEPEEESFYTALSFLHDTENTIVPFNSMADWYGWSEGVWEKPIGGEIGEKPIGYLNFEGMYDYDFWMYSHTTAYMDYNISDKTYKSFNSSFLIVNPGCGGASVEFKVYADKQKIYSKIFKFSDGTSSIQFDIPDNTDILTIEVNEFGSNGCDHFVLGEPKFISDVDTSISSVSTDIDIILGDVNNDGQVDLTDVKIVKSAISKPNKDFDTDLDNNGKTDQIDVAIVKAAAHAAIAAASPQKRKISLTTWGAIKRR